MQYNKKILAWTTTKKIRLAYYKEISSGIKQNILEIENEFELDKFPEYFKQPSTVVKPSLSILSSRQISKDPNNQNLFIISLWYNVLKIVELEYKPEEDRYKVHQNNKRVVSYNYIYLSSSSLFEMGRYGQPPKFIFLQFDFFRFTDKNQEILPSFSICSL